MKTPAALWTWSVEARIRPARLCAALEAVLARPVVPLGAADPARLPPDAVICDVWHTSGDFPTIVECYGPPAGVAETAVVAAVARRLGHSCLVADDTLNPGRHLLAMPDGTLRPTHVDVADTEDGAAHSNARPCTIATPRCRESAECRQSRWEPDLVVAPDLGPVSQSLPGCAGPRRRPAASGVRPHATPVCDPAPDLPDRRLDLGSPRQTL